MKLRKQDKMTVQNEQGNRIDDETLNADKTNLSNMHLTDDDKKKGNFKNFNLSIKTMKKLQSK